MATKMHKMLIDLISRKMGEKGYLPVAFDGKYYKCQDEIINIPPKIGRHRPDAIGINLHTKNICIGEAKTIDDLKSQRTKEQLIDYSNIIGRTSKKQFELIIGIPLDGQTLLHQLLNSLGLDGQSNISCIVLPEELVEDV
jgi:hypothetical protein